MSYFQSGSMTRLDNKQKQQKEAAWQDWNVKVTISTIIPWQSRLITLQPVDELDHNTLPPTEETYLYSSDDELSQVLTSLDGGQLSSESKAWLNMLCLPS